MLTELALLLFDGWLCRSSFEWLCLLCSWLLKLGPCDNNYTELFIWVGDSWYCLFICWILWFSLFALSFTVIINYYYCCFLVAGFHIRRRFLLLWPIVIFSAVAILSQVTYLVIWAVKPTSWSVPDAWWAKLIGFMM